MDDETHCAPADEKDLAQAQYTDDLMQQSQEVTAIDTKSTVDAEQEITVPQSSTPSGALFFKKVCDEHGLPIGKHETDFLMSLKTNNITVAHLENMTYEHWKETNMNIFTRAALQSQLSDLNMSKTFIVPK